jgi:hypothetical protein
MVKITKKIISIILIVMLSFSFAVIVNAVSEEDSRYTIVLQSTTDEEKVYSATAEMEDNNTAVSAYFEDITADTYNVLVYYLNVEGGNNSLCTSTQWTSEAEEGETDAIKVNYYFASEEINVMVTAIHHPDDDAIAEDKSNEIEQSEVNQSSNQEEKQESNVESQQKEDSSTWKIYIIILIVVVALIAIYLYYHKNKAKN